MKTRSDIRFENVLRTSILRCKYEKGNVLYHIRKLNRADSRIELNRFFSYANGYIDALYDNDKISLDINITLFKYLCMTDSKNSKRLYEMGL